MIHYYNCRNLNFNLIKICHSLKASLLSLMVWLLVFSIFIQGWSQVCVMQPFEIIKVRLQTQSATNKLYNGIADCFTKIVKN